MWEDIYPFILFLLNKFINPEHITNLLFIINFISIYKVKVINVYNFCKEYINKCKEKNCISQTINATITTDGIDYKYNISKEFDAVMNNIHTNFSSKCINNCNVTMELIRDELLPYYYTKQFCFVKLTEEVSFKCIARETKEINKGKFLYVKQIELTLVVLSKNNIYLNKFINESKNLLHLKNTAYAISTIFTKFTL